MITRLLVAALCCLCLLTLGDAANKTMTQVPVTLADIDQLSIRKNTEDPTAVDCIVGYRVLTDAGVQIGLNRSIKIPLTAGQQTTLKNFITTTVVPLINAQEGT